MSDERVRRFLNEDPEAPVLQQVGRYVVLRLIARGGMATVYEAQDPALGRRVALKLLREGDADPRLIARLHREASIAAQLQHPNIVAIHEVGMVRDAAGRPIHFIAMDYVDGRTLADVFGDASVAMPERLRMIEDVARAVAYAHGKGVVHRDLKPQNVLVDRAGRVALTDFGLARAEEFASHLTHSQAVLGTPEYMAPEQVEGRQRDIGPATDIYALGVMLYEMLTGRLPFQAQTAAKLYQQILNDEPDRPTRVKKSVDAEIEIICLKAMEKERTRRYASALELAEDIARHRRGESILARPPGTLYLLARGLRKRAAVVATAAIVLAAAAALWAVVGTVRARRQVGGALEEAARCEKEGRAQEARDAYRRVLDLSPGHAEGQAGLRRVEEALSREEADRVRAIADLKAKEENLREAQRLLEVARPVLDQAARSLYSRDAVHEEAVRQVEEVQRRIEEAAERAPELAAAHYLLGCAWEFRGWVERAEASLRRAIELDPGLGSARFRLGRLLMARAYQAWQRAQRPGEEPRRAAAEQLARDAGTELEGAVGSPALDQPLHRALAATMLAYVTGRRDTVAEFAREGIAKFGDQDGVEEFHWLAALTAAESAQLGHFNEAIRRKPKFALALVGRAYVRRLRGDVKGAVEDCSEALRVAPRTAGALVNRGEGRLALGQVDEAMRDFDEALALDDRLIEALSGRAGARQAKGLLKEALEDLDRAIGINPDVAQLWVNRGWARYEGRDRSGAFKDFRHAAELQPNLAEAHCGMAGLWLESSPPDLEQALACANTALRLNPRLVPALRTRALIHRDRGKPRDARADLARAREFATARERAEIDKQLKELGD